MKNKMTSANTVQFPGEGSLVLQRSILYDAKVQPVLEIPILLPPV